MWKLHKFVLTILTKILGRQYLQNKLLKRWFHKIYRLQWKWISCFLTLPKESCILYFSGVIWQWFAKAWNSHGSLWMSMFVTSCWLVVSKNGYFFCTYIVLLNILPHYTLHTVHFFPSLFSWLWRSTYGSWWRIFLRKWKPACTSLQRANQWNQWWNESLWWLHK